MNEQAILDEMLALLESNGVRIRSEPLGGSGGGLCTIKGKQTFFVDTDSETADMAGVCAQTLTKILDIEKIYLKPQTRQLIKSYVKSEKE